MRLGIISSQMMRRRTAVCDSEVEYTGAAAFPYSATINLGTGPGSVQLEYTTGDIPDKFEIWESGVKVLDTGYVGSTAYQSELNALLAARGLPPETITPRNAQNLMTAYFTKNPNRASVEVRVYAPFDLTAWSFKVYCPRFYFSYPTNGAIIGETFSALITVLGLTGTVTWDVSSGALPAGLSLGASTGVISGVPSGAPGTYSFTVRATDSVGTQATHDMTLVVGSMSSLLHLNGANNSTTFTDQTGKTWTRAGSAVISTAQSVFGGASLSAPAAADYISTSSNAAFAFGSGDFSIDFWVRPTNLTGVKVLYDNRSGVQNAPRIAVYTNGTQLRLYVSGADRIIGSNLSLNTWHHIAVCRKSGVTRMFVQGARSGSDWTDSTNYTQGPVYLATQGDNPGGTTAFLGFIDEVRVVKGASRFWEDFTPPAAPSDYPA